MNTLFLIMAFSGTLTPAPSKGATTYDAVKAGMKCHQNLGDDMECNYHVGRSLHFGIVGVGKADASIYFYSASVEGDAFAVFGLSHGCVIVRPGKALGQERWLDMAFVSPRNGKVFLTWKECQDDK